VLLREGRGRSERVDVGERGLDHLETRRFGAHQVRQLGAYAALLRLLVLRRQQQPVVELDGEQRLQEDGLAGLGAILDDAGDRVRRRRAQRHDEAPVPERHVALRDRARHVRLAHQAQETPFHLGAQLACESPRPAELGAGVVAHLAGLVERIGERSGDFGNVFDSVRDGGEERPAVRGAPQVGAHLAAGREQIAHVGQAARLERSSQRRGSRQRRREQRQIPERRAAELRAQPAQLVDEREALVRGLDGVERAQLGDDALAGRGPRALRDRRQHARKLERLEITGQQTPRS
jgi:hypothetical protein